MGANDKIPSIQIGADRLAAVAGGAVAMQREVMAPEPARRVKRELDLSRIRKCSVDETPKQRKKRLAAKIVNFSASILVRLIILGVAGFFVWTEFQSTGTVHNGYAAGILLMVADFGRIVMKAMTPGTK
ncbi:MAG: hypothetical protein GXP04_07635 [Alphaproteobacteria bacterium]|nr:hypothetical protein [Alphaproteobacteria bacterium]